MSKLKESSRNDSRTHSVPLYCFVNHCSGLMALISPVKHWGDNDYDDNDYDDNDEDRRDI